MSEDEAERNIFLPSHPLAYACEPVRRRAVERPVSAEGEGVAAAPGGDGSEERVGNTSWCTCGHCSTMPTTVASVCCREANLDSVLGELSCITLSHTFHMLSIPNRQGTCFSYVMYYYLFNSAIDRKLFVRLFRLTAYRQFTLWARGHLGRRSRVPIPACVVTSIRSVFPSPVYQGFEYYDSDEF
uniref:P2X purinoreceptor 7 intracellular domain-containing protein n=1 Tax=Myripristis murdjan TaxID=586833 RepID=A0A667YRC4_9TELE